MMLRPAVREQADVDQRIDVAVVLEHQSPARFVYRILFWSLLVTVLDGFDIAALSLSAPFMMNEWGIAPARFGIVFGCAQAGILAGALLLGYVSDRFGRRPTIIGSVAIFGFLSLLTPWTSNVVQLAAVRFAGGVVLGGIKPVIYSLNVESAPTRIRSSVVAIAYAGFSVGQILSGIVMGSLIAPGAWRTLFIIGGLAPLLVALALLVKLPESIRFIARMQTEGRPVPAGAKLAESLRSLGVPQSNIGESKLIASDEILAGSALRRADPRQLFEGPLLYITPLIWLVEILVVFVAGFFTYWTPTLARLLGATPGQASHALSAFALGAMVGPLLLTRLMDRFGRKWVAAGPVLAAAFLGSVGFKILPDLGLIGLVFTLGALVLGVQMSLGSLFFQTYPTHVRTYAIGWVILIGGLGSVSSPIVAGHLIGSGASPAKLFQITAGVMAVAAPLVLLLADTIERRVFCSSPRP